MAKSIVLYGVLLGTIICFCSYISRLGVNEVRGPRYGVRAAGDEERGGMWSVMSERMTGGHSEHYEESYFRSQIKQIYSAEIGVREKTGKNDGKRVEEYLAITQLGSGYAWCAAFVSWVFAEAGLPVPRTPWSPALFPKKRVIWERGNVVRGAFEVRGSGDELRLKPNTPYLKPNGPAPADVFGIYFPNLKRIAHVGFVDEWGEKYVITVEGNTNDAGGREGDGVYKKRRLISSIYQVSNWVQGQERIKR